MHVIKDSFLWQSMKPIKLSQKRGSNSTMSNPCENRHGLYQKQQRLANSVEIAEYRIRPVGSALKGRAEPCWEPKRSKTIQNGSKNCQNRDFCDLLCSKMPEAKRKVEPTSPKLTNWSQKQHWKEALPAVAHSPGSPMITSSLVSVLGSLAIPSSSTSPPLLMSAETCKCSLVGICREDQQIG